MRTPSDSPEPESPDPGVGNQGAWERDSPSSHEEERGEPAEPTRGPTANGEHENPPKPPSSLTDSQRLHPAAVALWTLEIGLPLAVGIVVLGAQPSLVLGFFVFIVGLNWVRYLRFRWSLDRDAFVVTRGILRRRRRVIRRDRIQAVDLERGVRHRLLGVVEVRVEAVGGSATEGRLPALAPALAEELRRTLLSPGEEEAEGDGTVPTDTDGHLLAHVTPAGLILAGLTGGRVGVAAALVGFLLQFIPEERVAGVVEPWLAQVSDPGPVHVAALVLAVVGIALLAGFAVSVAATVAVHWDFTLSRRGSNLWVRRGLLTEHRDSVPLRRIQAVRVEENVIRRLLGLASVRALVAGRAGGREDGGADLLLPVGSREEAFRIARTVAGYAGDDGATNLSPMPPAARWRRLIRAGAAALVAGSGTTVAAHLFLEGGWGTAALTGTSAAMLAGGVGTLLAIHGYRSLGWRDLDDHLIVREGVVNRRTSVVPTHRLQVVEARASPFQRRRGLTTLHLRTARPAGRGFTPRGLDLSREAAWMLADQVSQRLERRAGRS